MSTSPARRTRAPPIWPTEEEAATIRILTYDVPQSQQQILTSDDHDLRKKEKKLKGNTSEVDKSGLAKLVKAQDLELIKYALKIRKEDSKEADLNEAFLVACEEAVDLEIVRLLLVAGANIDTVSENGDTALHIACRFRDERLTKFLVEAGAGIESRDKLGQTPLHVSAARDFSLGATLLLQSGADIEAKDDNDWTPLYTSCGSGKVETQKILIARGADIESFDEEGWTPLHEAASWGNVENATILLAANAKLNVASIPDGFTPLHVAIIYDKKDMVRYLLDAGTDPQQRTSTGFTPLQLAVLANSQPVALELLKWSTEDIDRTSVDGSAAIHIAAGRGLTKMVELLLAHGADITMRDGNGLTPSEVAAKYGHHSTTTVIDTEMPETGSSRSASLCSLCQEKEVLALLERDRGFERILLGTYESVIQRLDCSFCNMVVAMLPVDVSKYVHTDKELPEIAIFRKGVAVPRLEVYFGGVYHGYIQVDNEFDLAEQVGAISLEEKYVAVQETDYSLIRSWISECEENHDVTSLVVTSLESQRVVHDVLLIDVEQQCVVSSTIEQRYVALSYVWGRIPGFQLTKQTASASKTPGFLRTVDLPRVTREAIDFVEKLEERYVWIDSLCIVQDDSVHKRIQLAQMDLIYSRAWVTLIALTAFDAESGLAGLSTNARRSARSIDYINGLRLLSKPPEFDTILEKSRYNSRAWTLQENILSPRCLYVTNHQIYYTCHGTLRAEDHQAVTFRETKASRSVNWFTDAMIEAQQELSPHLVAEDWMHHFKTYVQLVSNCTSRNLSDPRDVLNAVLGPLTLLSHYLGPFSLAGLPDSYLDHALLWAPDRRGPRTRNEHFPSWSWAGWNSHCAYFCRPVFLGSTSDPIPLVSAIGKVETFWQTAPKVVDRSYAQRNAADGRKDATHVGDVAQYWSINHIEERASAIQILSFDTEMIHRNHFDVVEKRPRLKMILLPDPTITILDKDRNNCGVLYDDFESIRDTVKEAESSGWMSSFMLLSRTDAPALSQDFFFNERVYERKPLCLLNVMLVKHRCDPTSWVFDEDKAELGGSRTQKFERVAIGQIHSDAWEASRPVLCHVALS